MPIVQHVTNVDTRVQPHQFEEIDAASKELQTVKLTGTMNYHIDGQFASDLFQRVGTDFAEKIIDPAFNDFIKTVVPSYSVNDILAKRDEIRSLREGPARGEPRPVPHHRGRHLHREHRLLRRVPAGDRGQAGRPAAGPDRAADPRPEADPGAAGRRRRPRARPTQRHARRGPGEGDGRPRQRPGRGQQALAASLTDQILQYQYIQKLTDKITVMLLPSGNQTIFDLKGLLGQASPEPVARAPVPPSRRASLATAFWADRARAVTPA